MRLALSRLLAALLIPKPSEKNYVLRSIRMADEKGRRGWSWPSHPLLSLLSLSSPLPTSESSPAASTLRFLFRSPQPHSLAYPSSLAVRARAPGVRRSLAWLPRSAPIRPPPHSPQARRLGAPPPPPPPHDPFPSGAESGGRCQRAGRSGSSAGLRARGAEQWFGVTGGGGDDEVRRVVGGPYSRGRRVGWRSREPHSIRARVGVGDVVRRPVRAGSG